jgi:arabinan endo-1,5-alpha-L-arabinosidase
MNRFRQILVDKNVCATTFARPADVFEDEDDEGRGRKRKLASFNVGSSMLNVGCSLFFLLLLFPFNIQVSAQPAPSLRGFIDTHDPSTLIKCKSRHYMFYTGQGILSKSSSDKIFWSAGPPVFNSAPAWTTNAVPGFAGIFWAPDILFFNGLYHLYYAVSTWGSQVSAIGLATNPTLDPSDPAYAWTDQGIVIQSGNGSPYNTIDPSLIWDASGNLWMAFGSYWNGIYLVQLDAVTGLRIAPNSPTYRLAYNSSIEASCLWRRGNYYYLFVNWGSCCSGVNSTYNIRVGRSTSVTGPYLDRSGVDMVNNGGTLFLRGTGKFAGPGHVGILSEGGTQWFGYHYYDGNAWAPQYAAYGNSDYAFVPLQWTPDDWPVYTNDWSAVYNFDVDASDANGQYYGLLQNGAVIQNDPIRGHVLNLNGTNQYVWLPPGVGYGQTFAAVVNWRGGGFWQRIFDFGFDTSKTVMMTPSSGDGLLRCDINPGGNLQIIQANSPLPANAWTHVALTLDGTKGVLYVNGAPVVTNSSMNLLPVNVAPQTNHLGRSKFTADPYFNGRFAAFRAYGRALSASEILAPLPVIAQPSDGALYQPGSSIAFAGSATDFMAVGLGASNLSWQIQYTQDGLTNIVFGPVTGITAGTLQVPMNATGGGYYRVLLTATDLSNRQATASATLWPAHPPAGWSSYYPFRGDAADANGHFNGTLVGGATFASDPSRGTVLNLSGANQYVSFPTGVSGMQTWMGWVKWNGGAAWQRIFDVGNDTAHYTVLTPSAANGKLRFNISVNGIPGEQILDAPSGLPVGVWTHVAVVMDGQGVVLYTNGVPVATNAFANLVPANLNPTNCWFGRSQFGADPYFNGQLSSIRLFSWPLSPSDIVTPQIAISQPAQGAIYRPGDTVAFAGSANDLSDTVLAASQLTWTVKYIGSGVTNVVLGPLTGQTNGSFNIPGTGSASTNGYYQVLLSALDGGGHRATNSVSIFPAPTSSSSAWASFYPFDSGAQDSSNIFNGTLLGGASIQTDSQQGAVLNLSGSSQYVNLPAGAGNAQTISGLFKWRGGGAWQRIFDFSRDTQHWLFLTPRDNLGTMQCAITADSPNYVRVVEAPVAFPLNQWNRFAVVLDGRQGILYLNGSAIAVNNSVNLLPSDVAPLNCWFGKSEFSADPYLNGMLDSFALNSAALAPEGIMMGPIAPTLRATMAGTSISLSWPQWSGPMNLYSTASLNPPASWQAVTNLPVGASGQWSLSLPVTGSARFFRLQWP